MIKSPTDDTARELYLYITTHSDNMPMIEKTYRRLQSFKLKGVYQSDLAKRAIYRNVMKLARKYTTVHGGVGDTIFSAVHLNAVTDTLEAEFIAEQDIENTIANLNAINA